MDPITMGLIGGGASLLGSIFSSNTSAQNTQAQIAASEQQQKTQNDFTERMSSTAYQRSAKDMTAAGLNPMMMFGSGSAASTPGGSSIQAPMPQNTSPMAGIGKAVDQVVNTAVQAKTFDKMTEEVAKIGTERARMEAETRLTEDQRKTEQAKPSLIRGQAEVAGAEADKLKRDVPRQEWDALKYLDLSHITDMARCTGNVASWGAGRFGDVIAPIGQAVGSASGFSRLWQNRVGGY